VHAVFVGNNPQSVLAVSEGCLLAELSFGSAGLKTLPIPERGSGSDTPSPDGSEEWVPICPSSAKFLAPNCPKSFAPGLACAYAYVIVVPNTVVAIMAAKIANVDSCFCMLANVLDYL
jgi:hypothetical protein